MFEGLFKKSGDNTSKSIELNVDGMTCNHCAMTIDKALRKDTRISEVDVSVSKKKVIVSGDNITQGEVAAIITKTGYKVLL